jgi:predicted RNA binding protein YcfA (HicA-like mRNA interferase family)
MPRAISVKKLVQKLHQFDFIGPFSGGRHMFMIKGNLKLYIPNLHKGDISKHLLSEILRQAGISPSEWNKLS